MSLGASGSVGDALVFSTWKGRPYVRKLVKPANPRSGGQVGMRSMFKFLAQDWATITPLFRATWEDRADQDVVSTFNAYMKYNQNRWRDFLAPSVSFPAGQILTPSTIGTTTAVAGVRSITLTIPITTEADGRGVMVFRSLSTGFTTAFDNLVSIGPIDGINDIVRVDTPLVPDEYFYNFRGFTFDGILDVEDGEISATVT